MQKLFGTNAVVGFCFSLSKPFNIHRFRIVFYGSVGEKMAGVYPGYSFEFLKYCVKIIFGVGEINHVELVTPPGFGKFFHECLEHFVWVKLNPNLLLFFYQKMFEVDL